MLRLTILLLAVGLAACQTSNTTFTQPKGTSVTVIVSSTASLATTPSTASGGGGGRPSEVCIVPSRYTQVIPFNEIRTMRRQAECAPGWYPADMSDCEDAKLVTSLLEAALHRARVCGKRGGVQIVQFFDWFVTPTYGASRKSKGSRNAVKLSGCLSAYPNDGWVNGQGVVEYRCQGSKRSNVVGVVADGEIVEMWGRH